MLIGYARVSTVEQETTLQLDTLHRSGVNRIYQEKKSGGAGTLRPELERMLDALRPGDVVAVYKIDRLARSLSQLLAILAKIEAAGAAFKSLTEPIDTTTLAGRMLMQMLGAFAEFERGMIRERTMAGRAAAVARGSKMGRPPALTDSEVRRAWQLYTSGASTVKALSHSYGCSVSAVRRAFGKARTLSA